MAVTIVLIKEIKRWGKGLKHALIVSSINQSFNQSNMFVCVLIVVCLFALHVCLYEHMEVLGIFLYSFPPYSLEMGYLTEGKALCFSDADWLMSSLIFYLSLLPNVGVTGMKLCFL